MLIHESELILGSLEYETRLTCYFDVLGWRGEIVSAGKDGRKIARVAAFPRMIAAAIASVPEVVTGARITSFSDNVVMSIPFQPDYTKWWAEIIAGLQFATAMAGFWIRGGLTVGDLIHTSDAVFGPALNRAYYLESKQAVYPRILIDEDFPQLRDFQSAFVRSEEGLKFFDPFTVDFAQSIPRKPPEIFVQKFNEISGGSISGSELPLNGYQLLALIYARACHEAVNAADDKVRAKFLWLTSRIAPRLTLASQA